MDFSPTQGVTNRDSGADDNDVQRGDARKDAPKEVPLECTTKEVLLDEFV